MKITIYIILTLIILVKSDPKPTGGALCKNTNDCGGIDAGLCYRTRGNDTGYCICYGTRGDSNCSYTRKSKLWLCGLQFLCFIGIGGVGNFILGNYKSAIAELITTAYAWTILICMNIGVFYKVKCLWRSASAPLLFLYMMNIIVAPLGLVMCIIDVVYILQERVTDINGYNLY